MFIISFVCTFQMMENNLISRLHCVFMIYSTVSITSKTFEKIFKSQNEIFQYTHSVYYYLSLCNILSNVIFICCFALSKWNNLNTKRYLWQKQWNGERKKQMAKRMRKKWNFLFAIFYFYSIFINFDFITVQFSEWKVIKSMVFANIITFTSNRIRSWIFIYCIKYLRRRNKNGDIFVQIWDSIFFFLHSWKLYNFVWFFFFFHNYNNGNKELSA